jgi:hypothetical protein
MKTIIAVAVAAAGFGFAAPAMAQDAPVNGTITVYGNDPCPDGEICVRAPETERFRIPKTLRDQRVVPPQRASWAVRAEDALEVGETGTGSCSTVGPGGQTGCFVKEATRANAEARERADRATNLPLP